MDEAIHGEKAVPQWYLALESDRIIGGMRVIENDFHPRKDLAPIWKKMGWTRSIF